MSAHILDGKAVAERVIHEVRGRVAARVAAGQAAPGLAVVLVGENAASQIYVRNKRRTSDAAGIRSLAIDLPASHDDRRIARAHREGSIAILRCKVSWSKCHCRKASTPSA